MTDPLAAFRDALRDRYEIEGEIGRGGMATVYRARDLRHDRYVALKLLHPELAASLGPERFQREIKLAARLQHPHILTVHDSGESAGRLWFTMPFIDGETLRTRLQHEGQLAVPDALRIAREAADALDYAHRHDVVHRDIKPENILLSDGHALVADFGIARSLGAAGSNITEPGMAVGTPAYMSPEQSSGTTDVGARSDIYSLGVVLYEMLAGEAPFTGPSAQAVIARALTETPRSLKTVRATVPTSVQTLTAKAMARSPADRFTTAGEMARALDDAQATVRSGEQRTQPGLAKATVPTTRRIPMAMVLGLGVLLGGGVLFAWRQSHATAPTTTNTGPKRLAVLPFENLGATDDEYFAQGVTDEVRGKLAALPGMQVTARGSSGQYAKSSKTPAEIGRDLGVDYLLTGTVRWEKGAAGNRVRVSPELIEVSTGASKWQQPFDAALTDVFQVQGDIAGRVAQALDVALSAGQQEQLKTRPTQNLAAYDLFLKGDAASDALSRNDPPSLRGAIVFYEQAVALDSTFALAWTRLARAYSRLYFAGVASANVAEAARQALGRARALAPGSADVLHAEGTYDEWVRQDSRAAIVVLEAGHRLAPENVSLLTDLGLARQTAGDWNQAMQNFAEAARLDPRSTDAARRYGSALLWTRQYPEAAKELERAAALDPEHLGLMLNGVMLHLAKGDLPGAQAMLHAAPASIAPTVLVAYLGTYWDLFWVLDDAQQALLLRLPIGPFDGDAATRAFVLAQTYWVRGDTVRARAMADTGVVAYSAQLRSNPTDAQSMAFIGLLHAMRGRKAEALQYAQRAVTLVPDSLDGYSGPYYEHLMARTLTIVGEYDRAIDIYEKLLARPYYLSKDWLKIDPATEPLRKLPRFQKLVGG